MTRITDSQTGRTVLAQIMDNKELVDKYARQVSTGLKVEEPGDSTRAGTISQFQTLLSKISDSRDRIKNVEGWLQIQESVLNEANELMVRAKEIASQAANETNGTTERAQLAAEVFQLRDQLANLANTKYQDRYIFGGAADDDPPYDLVSFTEPLTGSASEHYEFDSNDGRTTTRTVRISDDLSLQLNTAGNQLFDTAMQGLEQLGRALEGYRTDFSTNPPSGTAYTFPGEFEQQSIDIRATIGMFDQAREQEMMPERADLAGRMRRLQSAESVLEASEFSAQDALGRLQHADLTEAASLLSGANTSLEAALTVSARALGQTLLDYL